MPLLRFDLYEGRTDLELKALLDAVHRAMLAAFKVPERDRYQIVHEHKPSRMIMQDTGLGIPRMNNFVFIQVTTRPRSKEMKELFYRLAVEELQKTCDIAPTDVIGARQFHNQHLVQRRQGEEVEAVEAFDGWELGCLYTPLHHASFAINHLHFSQPHEMAGMVNTFCRTQVSNLFVLGKERRQLQRLQMVGE